MLPVDLRSDTVTRPTPGMRKAIAEAVVGDDVFGDDPTAAELERRVAELTGKEAALFVPSGTMGNQLAVNALTRPGEQIVLDAESHIFLYEQAGVAATSGCLVWPVRGERGVITPAHLDVAMDEDQKDDNHVAPTTLVCVENTQNRHSGAIVPLDALRALSAHARDRGVRVHLDGARLWNASIASGIPLREWAAVAETVMMCFSKGLGAPIGSILAGSGSAIARARWVRKRLGGGMRQVGILAAACLYALDHHLERLAEDHRRARTLAAGFAAVEGVSVLPTDTNIVIAELEHPALDRDELVSSLEARGLRTIGFGRRRVRAIVHLDVDDEGISRAIRIFREVVEARTRTAAAR